MRRSSTRVLTLLAFVLAALALSSASASAAACHQDGTTKVCTSAKKQTCRAGIPTVCERWRNTCRLSKRFFTCTYVRKDARCRGDHGHRCRTSYTRCRTNTNGSDCKETQQPFCSISKKRHFCEFVSNVCSSRRKGATYRCDWKRSRKDCRSTGACRYEVKICVSRNGYRHARCHTTVNRTTPSDGSGDPAGGSGSGDDGGTGSTPVTVDDGGSSGELRHPPVLPPLARG